jgi:endoglucanase
MDERDERALKILEELGARPAVPFFEAPVAGYVATVLEPLGLDVRQDSFGNIIAHLKSGPETAEPPVAFVAHMDHPGFEILSAGDEIEAYIARAIGRVPEASLRKSVPALVLAPDGQRLPSTLLPRGAEENSPDQRMVNVELGADVALEPPVPVVFDLPDFELDDGVIRMRALDDLSGCAGILAALERLVSEGADTDMYAVFTRAEEGGLFGARLMAEERTLPDSTLVVSLEASPVIPGVAQGSGPIIRTGDAAYTFDAEAEQVLIAARESIREIDPEFRCQRQLMSGGACEATAFAVFGYRTTGIAFPLGNYHNATTGITDPDGGVGAEYIELQDFLGGVRLITEAAKSVGKRSDSPTRRRMRQVSAEVRHRLEETA